MITLDCTGMLCPLPIIELGKHYREVEPGDELELICDDPAAAFDVVAWCRMQDQELVSSTPLPVGDPTARLRTSYLIRRV